MIESAPSGTDLVTGLSIRRRASLYIGGVWIRPPKEPSKKRMLEYPELIIAILFLVFVAVLTCITVIRIFLAWKRDGKRTPFRS